MDDSRRIKRRQAILTLAAVCGVIWLVVLGLYLSDPSRRIARAAKTNELTDNYRTPAAGVDPSEVWISRSEDELHALKDANQTLQRQLGVIRGEVEHLKKTQRHGVEAPSPMPSPPGHTLPSPAPSSPAPRPTPHSTAPSGQGLSSKANLLPPLPPPPAQRNTSDEVSAPGVPSGILMIDLTTSGNSETTAHGLTNPKAGANPSTPRTVRDFLPAGTFAKAILLSGLDAPTGGLAKTNPQPVLLRLLDPGTLPNRFHSHIRECFITAAGYGDLASERAYLRLEKISCVLHDGTVLEKSLKGFVAGEDGKAGLRGRVVSKQGQMIARALIAGIAGGIGKGISQSFTTLSTSALGSVRNVSPSNIAQYGLANGFASALDRISQWYLQRANELYPVLEVDAGRTVDIVLDEGLDLGVNLAATTHSTGGV